IHPRLDHRDPEITQAGEPPVSSPDEGEELLEIPSVGLDPSFRSATLLPLVRKELLDQIRQGMRNGIGPPIRTTTTFLPLRSMERHDPPVKGGDAAIGTGSDDRGHRAGESPLRRLWRGRRRIRTHWREGPISVRTAVCREWTSASTAAACRRRLS